MFARIVRFPHAAAAALLVAGCAGTWAGRVVRAARPALETAAVAIAEQQSRSLAWYRARNDDAVQETRAAADGVEGYLRRIAPDDERYRAVVAATNAALDLVAEGRNLIAAGERDPEALGYVAAWSLRALNGFVDLVAAVRSAGAPEPRSLTEALHGLDELHKVAVGAAGGARP